MLGRVCLCVCGRGAEAGQEGVLDAGAGQPVVAECPSEALSSVSVREGECVSVSVSVSVGGGGGGGEVGQLDTEGAVGGDREGRVAVEALAGKQQMALCA